MQNAEWIALFRQLPKELHSQLVLVAQNRSDISVDTIFRLEPSFMVIRGRMGGTTETGLLFLFPYDQISSVFINREVKEGEVDELFDKNPAVGRLAASHQAANGDNGVTRLNGSQHDSGPRSTTAAAIATVATLAPVMARPGGDPSSVARNNLLERLRAARNAAMPTNGK